MPNKANNKNIPWFEIQARYENGEPVRSIAASYKNVTANMISQKAYREKWKRNKEKKKEKISQKVEDAVVENVLLTRERIQQELCRIAYADMADYLDIDEDSGALKLKSFSEMPNGASRAVKKVKEKRIIRESNNGESTILDNTVEYEHHDKLRGIEILLKMLGFDSPKINPVSNQTVIIKV